MRIIYIHVGIFLFLTISFYVQKLSISAGNKSVSKSIDNPELQFGVLYIMWVFFRFFFKSKSQACYR
jgi:hypothetical protein